MKPFSQIQLCCGKGIHKTKCRKGPLSLSDAVFLVGHTPRISTHIISTWRMRRTCQVKNGNRTGRWLPPSICFPTRTFWASILECQSRRRCTLQEFQLPNWSVCNPSGWTESDNRSACCRLAPVLAAGKTWLERKKLWWSWCSLVSTWHGFYSPHNGWSWSVCSVSHHSLQTCIQCIVLNAPQKI